MLLVNSVIKGHFYKGSPFIMLGLGTIGIDRVISE